MNGSLGIEDKLGNDVRELGVFCGTFNPIHWGHLLIAECARDQFKLEKVIFVISPRPPHRSDLLLDAQARFLLVSAAVATSPNFEASRIELERSGPSYTADTIKQLSSQLNSHDSASWRINLILGGDNLSYLNTWYDHRYILRTCRILVAPRRTGIGEELTTESAEKMYPENTNVEIIEFPDIAISSSAVRKRLRERKSVLYMVPPAVNELILARNFFAPE
jgi:nicotinate-nucleotide adenylyltransferase